MGRPTFAVRITATAVGGVYTIAMFLAGVHLDTGVKKLLAFLPVAAGVGLSLWDTWFWRAPGVRQFVKRPWLEGTWVTELQPTVESHIPEGGSRGPIEAYVVIRQSFWGIAVRQYTAESTSNSRTHFWQPATLGMPEGLVFTYENLPKQEVQHRSERHFGTCQFDPTTSRPTEISGYYFTDRYTKGDMTLRLYDRTTGHESFAAARRHCLR